MILKPKITLGEDLEISRIVTGFWQIADMERNGEKLDIREAAKQLEIYSKAGFNTFDMADHYGSSEIIAGHFRKMHQLEAENQFLTKWVPKPGKITKEDTRNAVELALQRLQTKSIDLFQFHAWHYPNPSWLDALFYLNELRDEGMIKNLGVTNFDAAHLRIACASGIPIISNQVSHSLLDQRANGKMAEVCKKYNVKLLAYGTLAGGFLTDKWVDKTEPRQEELKTWSEMKYKRFIDATGGWDGYQHLLNSIKLVASKHDVSIANIASRIVFENLAVAAIIIGARLGQSDHIEDNKKILRIKLSDKDLQLISNAQSELNPVPGNCGDEYRRPPFLTASGDLSHHLDSIPKVFNPVQIDEDRVQVFSGTVWEGFAGYCRAVRDGNQIYVSGTTATHGQMMIGGNDAAAQAHFIIDKIEAAIESLGGTLKDVVRTRTFVNDLKDWEPVARAHGERFNSINPANTLVKAPLIGDGYLVEIEAKAVVR